MMEMNQDSAADPDATGVASSHRRESHPRDVVPGVAGGNLE